MLVVGASKRKAAQAPGLGFDHGFGRAESNAAFEHCKDPPKTLKNLLAKLMARPTDPTHIDSNEFER